MKVLVCGGRDFFDEALIFRTLDNIDRDKQITLIIHGGARGADGIVTAWAIKRDKPWIEFLPDWKKHGYRAGPIRNQQMLDEGKPDLVVAFPGGRGTADMIRRAEAAGVRVIEVL